ncbi:MAG: CotH kinase family protein [Paludibacteraceae bacterium]|nr:CotH kinase family protein [Paludibacteraceae bacterium]
MNKWILTLGIAVLSQAVVAQTSNKLSGTPMGAIGVDYNTSQMVNNVDLAFDGDLNTFYASYYRKFGWAGLELDQPYVITRVGYAPRYDWSERMKLGVFEGANKADFSDAIPIFIIRDTPAEGQMTYQDVSCSRGFKYVRFCHTNPAYGTDGFATSADTVRCNVAELEFYGYPSAGNDEHLYTLTNLPTVTIHLFDNRDIVDRDNWLEGTISVISNNENGTTDILTDSLKAQGRGNYSFGFAKKPYKFKLNNKARLLDMPAKSKRWTLINNTGDKTLMRNLVAFDIAKCLNMEYVPAGRSVDVILNGEYKGNYQLCDQIEVNKNRVNIEEMLPTFTTGTPLTGGYLIEIDAYASGQYWEKQQELAPLRNKTWFYSNKGNPVTIKYPKDDEIVSEQSAYIINCFNTLESRVYANNYQTATPNYKDMFDIKSFVKHFIVGELSGNTDTYWSVYMYKHRGNDTLYTGPVWDFDIAFENDNRTYPINNKSDYIYKSGSCTGDMRNFVNRLLADPACKLELQYRWNLARKWCIQEDYLLGLIDDYAENLQESQALNFERWPYLNHYVHQNPRVYGSYQGEVDNVKTYLANRIAWLDNKIGYMDVGDDVDEYSVTKGLIFTSDAGTLYLAHFAEGSTYEIYNTIGQQVKSGVIANDYETISLNNGLYIVRIAGLTRKVLVR